MVRSSVLQFDVVVNMVRLHVEAVEARSLMLTCAPNASKLRADLSSFRFLSEKWVEDYVSKILESGLPMVLPVIAEY